MPYVISRRPPFENRWTSGRKAWRWYRSLEQLGADNARMRLARQDPAKPIRFPEPDIPLGFVHDWLNYRDRKHQRDMAMLGVAATLVVGLVVVAVVVGPQPVF